MLCGFISNGVHVNIHMPSSRDDLREALCGPLRHKYIRGRTGGHRCVDGVVALNNKLLRLLPASSPVQFRRVDDARSAFGKGGLKV